MLKKGVVVVSFYHVQPFPLTQIKAVLKSCLPTCYCNWNSSASASPYPGVSEFPVPVGLSVPSTAVNIPIPVQPNIRVWP